MIHDPYELAKEYEMDLAELALCLGKRDREECEDAIESFYDRILSVTRIQTLTKNGWETTAYEIQMQTSPYVIINTTEYKIIVEDDGRDYVYLIMDELAKEFLDYLTLYYDTIG